MEAAPSAGSSNVQNSLPRLSMAGRSQRVSSTVIDGSHFLKNLDRYDRLRGIVPNLLPSTDRDNVYVFVKYV
jgi:hypothetical protein